MEQLWTIAITVPLLPRPQLAIADSRLYSQCAGSTGPNLAVSAHIARANGGKEMMKSVFALGLSAALILTGPVFAGAKETVWNQSRALAETSGFLKDMIRIDTQNPPGNESKVALFLASVLTREGIPFEIIESVPGRASIVARLKGNGSKRPILIMAHEDVVPVQRDHWSVDPFAAIEKDAIIYGRGAFDDKAMLASNLKVFLELKRLSVPLARDVIFLAESDEETGGSGIRALI